jgi:dephospho-CoA kinase
VLKVGLTGGIGSGKTTVANHFARLGAPVIDTDVIAHRVTAPDGLAMPAIRTQFGPDFVAPDGSLDRARMRALVFNDADAKRRLEALTHPLIRRDTDREMANARGPYLICVVPLLVESGDWRDRIDRVLVIDCDVETQIARVIGRNGFTREQVMAIIARQATRDARVAAADDVIVNDMRDFSAIAREIEALHARYLEFGRATGH